MFRCDPMWQFQELRVAREESYSLYIYTINAVMQPAMFWAGYSGNLGEQVHHADIHSDLLDWSACIHSILIYSYRQWS